MEASRHEEVDTLLRRIAELEQAAVSRNGSQRTAENVFPLLDQVSQGVACLDAEWRFTYVNASVATLTRMDRHRLLGSRIWDLFPGLQQTPVYEQLHAVATTGVCTRSELFYAPWNASVEVDGCAFGSGLILFIRDRTGRKFAEENPLLHEQRYRSLAAATSAIVWTTGPDGRFLEGQYSWEAFTGQTADDYRDLGGMAAIHPDDRGIVARTWERAIASGEVFELEYRLWHAPAGAYAHVCSRGAPVFAPDGTLREWVGTILDVTERKRVEQALREQEAQYRTLLASTPDVISRFDRGLRIVYTSPAVQRHTGLPPEHFIGRTHAEAGLPAELSAKLDAELRLMFETAQPRTVEFTLPSPEGELRRFQGIGIPELGPDGVQTVLTIIRDVTDQKNAEREQEQLQRELMLLIEASSALLASPRSSEVLHTIVRLAQRFIAADGHAVWRRQSASHWAVTASSGLSEEFIASGQIESADAQLPEGPVLIVDVATEPMLEARHASLANEGIRSMMVVPIRIHTRLAGTIVFYWKRVHEFAERATRVATALANLAASALSTAELYDAQIELRHQAEASERRAAFLAQAGALLSSSLDYETTLQSVAQLAVPDLADWCSVDVVAESGEVKRVAVEHSDPEKVRLAYEYSLQYPPRENDLSRVALRTGQPALVSSVPDELLVKHAHDPEHLRLLRELGLRSFIIVPMVIHGRSFGIISFVHAESGRRYNEADLQLAREIAHRAATAIEHARLYRDVQIREQRYRSLVAATTSIVWAADPDGCFVEPQRSWERYTGQPWEEHQGWGWMNAIHPDDREQIRASWLRRADQGLAYQSEARVWHHASQNYRYFTARAAPVRNPDGTIREWVGTVTDVHESKQAEQERDRLLVREKAARQTAELLNRVGPILGSELDQQRLVQKITDIATELTGAAFGALFHNLIDDRGESYVLYTLSGVPREAFANFPMPRATDLFGPTFRGEAPVRCADVFQDARYGKNPPYHGMPDGHLPVRSYLAAPVVSRSGEVLGGLFFGHPEPDRFTEQHEAVAAGVAAQAAIALDNARLYSDAQRAREALERTNQELRRANSDLQQFAYSASHDLREPLRMVSVYSQLLERKCKGRLDAAAEEYLRFAIRGAQRMEMLLRDLLVYTEAVSGPAATASATDSAIALAEALTNLQGAIQESDARIESSELPFVAVSYVHLLQLFQNLIGNAIKYRSNVGPFIRVSADREDNMWRFCVEDNGIGIAPEFAHQIFGIFKRLHSGNHEGTGVGLAICQKIADRYGGRIWVEPASGMAGGSRFFFTLPTAIDGER